MCRWLVSSSGSVSGLYLTMTDASMWTGPLIEHKSASFLDGHKLKILMHYSRSIIQEF